MRPPKPEREEQGKERAPTARPSMCAANEHVAGRTRRLSSSGFSELSRQNSQSGPNLKEWKQVGETEDRHRDPCTAAAGALFRGHVQVQGVCVTHLLGEYTSQLYIIQMILYSW